MNLKLSKFPLNSHIFLLIPLENYNPTSNTPDFVLGSTSGLHV